MMKISRGFQVSPKNDEGNPIGLDQAFAKGAQRFRRAIAPQVTVGVVPVLPAFMPVNRGFDSQKALIARKSSNPDETVGVRRASALTIRE